MKHPAKWWTKRWLWVLLAACIAVPAAAVTAFRSAIPFGTATSWSSAVGNDPNAVRGPWFNTNGHALGHANGVDWQFDNINYSVQAFGAVGDGVTDDTAAINLAIAATPAGSILYFPPGNYLVSGVGSQLFTISTTLTIQGAGWGLSKITVASTVPNTTDVFHVTSATQNIGVVIRDLYITATQGAAKTITTSTNATPISVSATAHGFSTGQTVTISGVLGNKNTNGTWVVTVVDANTFTLNGSYGSGAYTSGGTARYTPGRHGINFDVDAGQPLQNFQVIHNRIDQLGGRAIVTTNTVPAIDGIFIADIYDNILRGGINLRSAGDSINIHGNTITGGFNAIDLDMVHAVVPVAGGGAHMTVIDNNNVTSQGCFVRITNGSQIKITQNNVEPTGSLTTGADTTNCPNNASLDADGAANNLIYGLLVEDNYLGGFGLAGNVIRLNFTYGAVLRENDCEPFSGPGPFGYQITANSQLSHIEMTLNESGQLPATQISDSGTRTTVEFHGNNGTEFGTSIATRNNVVFWGGTAQAGDILKVQASDGTTEYLEIAANGHVLLGGATDSGVTLNVGGGGVFTGSITTTLGSVFTNNIDAASGGLVVVGAVSNVQLGGGTTTSTISVQGKQFSAIEAISTSGSPNALKVQAAAHTTLANAEFNDLLFDESASAQITGGGTIADFRTAFLKRRTYTATSATTVTEASTLYIDNAPNCSTNFTCSNTFALNVAAGTSNFGGSVLFAGGATASGASGFDLSGSSGLFKTSTGVSTFKGSSNTFDNGITLTTGNVLVTVGGTGVDTVGSAQLNLGHTNAASILMGKSGATTTNSGSIRVIQGFAPGGYRTAASTITAAVTDGYIGVTGTGARTVNLPAASTCLVGQSITIQEVGNDVGTITINRAGADTINGATTATISAAFGSKVLECDGVSAWFAR